MHREEEPTKNTQLYGHSKWRLGDSQVTTQVTHRNLQQIQEELDDDTEFPLPEVPITECPTQPDAEKIIAMLFFYAFHVDRTLKLHHGNDTINALIQVKNLLQAKVTQYFITIFTPISVYLWGSGRTVLYLALNQGSVATCNTCLVSIFKLRLKSLPLEGCFQSLWTEVTGQGTGEIGMSVGSSSNSCQAKYDPNCVFLLRLHLGLSCVPGPRSFDRKALDAKYQQGNVIITKIEAGTIKSFHFNLEV